MLLTEYDEKAEREYLRKEAIELGLEEGRAEGFKQGMQEGMQQGIQQGIQQGEDRITLLMQKLLESDRMEDLQKALRDREYQKELLKRLEIL